MTSDDEWAQGRALRVQRLLLLTLSAGAGDGEQWPGLVGESKSTGERVEGPWSLGRIKGFKRFGVQEWS